MGAVSGAQRAGVSWAGAGRPCPAWELTLEAVSPAVALCTLCAVVNSARSASRSARSAASCPRSCVASCVCGSGEGARSGRRLSGAALPALPRKTHTGSPACRWMPTGRSPLPPPPQAGRPKQATPAGRQAGPGQAAHLAVLLFGACRAALHRRQLGLGGRQLGLRRRQCCLQLLDPASGTASEAGVVGRGSLDGRFRSQPAPALAPA